MNAGRLAILCLLSMASSARLMAQDAKPGTSQPHVDPDGTISTPGGMIPFSAAASKQALRRFQEILIEDKAAPGIANPLASRKFYDQINSDRAARMQKMFPVVITNGEMAGIPVATVSAADARTDDPRVLINLHGGAFLWGAGSGGLVEAIPVASVSKIKVVTVDYREGPENQYPAANEDVEKVYRALLKSHRPQRVGIYGCSAGGGLTAQSVLWFHDKHLPAPAAIGIFCAGVWTGAGDSGSTGPLLMGQTLPSTTKRDWPPADHPYFTGQAFKAFTARVGRPGALEAALAAFPPTLLISGTRDMALSQVLVTNEMLTKAGVIPELHVWEGMWHSFFSDPELPESREAYGVMAHFFVRHLSAEPDVHRKKH